MQELGRLVLVMGLILVLIGGLLLLGGRIPWLGRLPGDILIQRRNFTFYFPLATGILISIVLTLFLWLVSRR
jgi:hypothetical protein